ncbi:PKD domain-containing protein [Lewinella sp. IMCC34191]|uniref:PKD domain-containing protein n=1 Tax=Lewinella sp. IMCC34191 TaxID=2259172 RepID=UPI000E222A25|nr:PKD domain-containing protein [Lewinella sp. IMCC34191]
MKSFYLTAIGLAVLFHSVSLFASGPTGPVLSFDRASITLEYDGRSSAPVAVVGLTTSDGSTPVITLSDDPHAGNWLIYPSLASPGQFTVAVRSGLPVGTYQTNLIATAPDYDAAEISISLHVTGEGAQQPRVIAAYPPTGSRGVPTSISLSANDLYLPNPVDGIYGVANESIDPATVYLTKLPSGATVPATVNGTGGGDAINLTPLLPLEANTTYRFTIAGVTDLSGSPFEVYQSTFTTGTGGGDSGGNLGQVAFRSAGAVTSGQQYTSLTIGPDGKLYGLSITGTIDRWDIAEDGSLAGRQTLTVLPDTYGVRSAIGFTFAPSATADNLVAYVTHCSGTLNNAPAWDGKLSRLSGPDLENEALVITNLPRSRRDHLTNSIAFRPGEDRVLYFLQGSNTAGGAPDNAWGNRLERLLSASALRLDLDKLPESAWPLNAKTTMNAAAINAVDTYSPTLGPGTGTYTENGQVYPDDGTYNPYFTEAPLTLFATGIRNAYDLVWHSNGQLYVPTNGTAAGSNSPASIDGTRRPDGSLYSGTGYPPVPGALANNTQRDWLFRIDPGQAAGYYGHPNPLRGEFVLNRGSVDVSTYPAGVIADPNYRGAAYDFAYNKSPNGVIEYRSNAENGNLQGALLVCRYSGGSDLIALMPDGPNGDIQTIKIGIPGFTGFTDPLDLTEDVNTGNLYVSDFGTGEIVLLKPTNQATAQPAITLSRKDVVVDATVGEQVKVTLYVANVGNAPLLNTFVNLQGPEAAAFAIEATQLPDELLPNSSASVEVTFQPATAGVKFASLTLGGSNGQPTTIPLNGLGRRGTEAAEQPSLQEIFNVLRLDVDSGDEDPTTSTFDVSGNDYNRLLGDELDLQQFQRASDGPVTVEVLAAFDAESVDPVTALGWYTGEDAANATEVLSISNALSGNGQSLYPTVTGAASFDPGRAAFGLYSRWPVAADRLVFGEHARNTFDPLVSRHLRVYPYPGEEDAYILAFERETAGYEYQDLVAVVRNVEAATGTTVTALPKELLFETTVDTDGNATMTATVQLRNEGTAPVEISSSAFTGAFADQYRMDDPAGIVLLPGVDRSFDVTYAPDRTYDRLGHQPASLSFSSTGLSESETTVALHGLKKAGFEGDAEPALQDVLLTLGYGVDVGWTTLANHLDPSPMGEEVITPYFQLAGPGSAELIPLARYSPAGAVPFGWFTDTPAPNRHQLATLADGLANAQRLYPPTESGGTRFNPRDSIFGVYIDLPERDRSDYSTDVQNDGNVHRTRVYPARDRSGQLLPNTYILCFEEAANGDYQDNVFLLRNVKPAGDGAQVLSFIENSMSLSAIPGQFSAAFHNRINASGPRSDPSITLSSDRPWIVLPQDALGGVDLPFGVDAFDLEAGNYSATVTATSPGYLPTTVAIAVEVSREKIYTLRVNFQDDNFDPPADYVADIGEAFGLRPGGHQYGWIDPVSRQPAENLDNAEGKSRGVLVSSPDVVKLVYSFNVLDNVKLETPHPRHWEVAVPNGSYRVAVGIGDVKLRNSRHTLRVEGVTLVDDFIPEPDNMVTSATGVVTVKDGKLTVDDIGVAPWGNTKISYLRIEQVSGPTIAPDVRASITGPMDTEGHYRGSAIVSLSATDRSGGSEVISLRYSLDGAPFTAYERALSLAHTGSSSFEAHSLKVRAVDARGNVGELDTMLTVAAASGALLRIENMSKLRTTDLSVPGDHLFSFQRIKEPDIINGQPTRAHDRIKVRMHNEGTAPLTVYGFELGDTARFAVEGFDPANGPITVPPGTYTDVTGVFKAVEPKGVGKIVFYDTLRILSNADNAGEVRPEFRGGYMQYTEGGNELSNQSVFETLGFGTEVGRDENRKLIVRPSSDRPSDERVDAGYEGDLILSGYFEQADRSQEVRMIHLGAFHGFSGSRMELRNSSNQVVSGMSYNHGNYYYNSLLPRTTNFSDEIAGDRTSTINGSFQIYIEGYRSTGHGYQNSIMGIRVYKAKDAAGNVIPNAYIAIQDYVGSGCDQGGGNCDWQDNIAYITNIRPVAKPSAGEIADRQVDAGTADRYVLGEVFDRGYPGNRLSFTGRLSDGSPLPEWITVDPRTGTVSSLPPYQVAGRSYDLRITATDYNLVTATAGFQLRITADTGPCEINANVDGRQKVIYCAGASVELRGFTGSGIYRWTGPNGYTSSQRNPKVTEPGTYTLRSGTLANGDCGRASTVVVTEDFSQSPALTISASSPYLSCTVGTVVLTAESAAANATFAWTSNGRTIGTGATLSVSKPGRYDLSASTGDGCSTETSITVTEDFTPPSAGVGGTVTLCEGAGTVSLYEQLASLGGEPQPGGQWTFFDRPVTDAFDTATGFRGTYRYTVGGRVGCAASSAELVVRVIASTRFYRDADGDGFGDSAVAVDDCSAPGGYVSNASDCNDANPNVHPGAAEICDGTDNNCDGAVDEGAACVASGPAVRINAGGPATYHDGILFSADQHYYDGNAYTNSRVDLPTIYQSERTSGDPFYVRYYFPLERGEYLVRLHFAEIYWGAPGGGSGGDGKRIFDVVAENTKLMDDYDIHREVGSSTAVVKEFRVTNNDNYFFIYFDGRRSEGGVDQPKISALEVISMDAAGPNASPVARATATPSVGTAPQAVSLDGSLSTDSDGSIVSYQWNWTGGSASGPSTMVTLEDGTYEVTLTVTDNDGARDAATVQVEIGTEIEDADGDGIADEEDNCPTRYNPEQNVLTFYADADGDGYGDPANSLQSCFPPDGYVTNNADNCPDYPSDNLTDTDGDGWGDACDDDDDNDGVRDTDDCAPLDREVSAPRLFYADRDGDGYGDPAEATLACVQPAGFVTNGSDNCPATANPGQEDSDADGIGDSCTGAPSTTAYWLEAECGTVGSVWTIRYDDQASETGYVDARGNNDLQNAPADVPANQVRLSIPNGLAGTYHLFARISAADPSSDSYYFRINGGNWNPWYRSIIADGTFHWNRHRNQIELTDGINTIDFAWREGDARLDKVYISKEISLPDGLGKPATNCGSTINQAPVARAAASPTEGVAPLDVRLDGTASSDDAGIVRYVWTWNDGGFATGSTVDVSFPTGFYDVTLTVIDAEGAADSESLRINAYDPNADSDGDGVPDLADNCPTLANPDQLLPIFYADVDGDGWGDANDTIRSCSPPPGYADRAGDLCPTVAESVQHDFDGDGLGDACDPDDDNDGVPDELDCGPQDDAIGAKYRYYRDEDGDGFGNPGNSLLACTLPEGYVTNGTDNCPYLANPDQLDSDGNGTGDACEGIVNTRNRYWLEAECALVGSSWSIQTDELASERAYVHAPGKYSMSSPPADVEANYLRFVVDQAEAGSYYLFGRIAADDSDNDSYWIRVNNGDWVRWYRGITKDGQFHWNQLPGTTNLTAGVNVLDIAFREGGARLDKLHLSTENPLPTGEGQAADNCGAPAAIPPVAAVAESSINGAAPLSVLLNGTPSYDPDGTVESYAWSWGENSMNGDSIRVDFPAGTWTVTLTVTDNDGQFDRTTVEIEVLDPELDTDGDSVPDLTDNCPEIYNPDQALTTYYADEDGDGLGDPEQFLTACSQPAGFVNNDLDNCPTVASSDTGDADGDGIGDPCDTFEGESIDLAWEAVCADLGAKWEIRTSTEAVSGSFIRFSGNHRTGVPTGEEPDQQANFAIEIPEDGTYYVFFRLNAPSSSKNSFWVRVDEGPWMKFWKKENGDQILTDGFEWTRLTDDTAPVSFDFAAGSHVLTVANREAGTELDRIQLSTNHALPDGQGVAADCDRSVAARFGMTIEEQALLPKTDFAHELLLYPNPVSDRLYVAVRSPFLGRVTLRTYDFGGKVVDERTEDKSGTNLETFIDTHHLPSGTYRTVMITGDRTTVRTFIKVR